MMSLKKISFAVMFSALALTQSVGAATIVSVPAPVPTTVTSPEGPVSGEFQGMVTSVMQGFVSINNSVLQVTGDTAVTYNGGLTSLAAGQIVNYSYATDVDGVKIATTIDVYPTQAVSGTVRTSGLSVVNSTGGVSLPLYNGSVIEYYQPYAYIYGLGTNTSYGVQLVNYTGFLNPTTGHILATSGYMSDIPVTFRPSLPNAVVGQVYGKQYTMELGIYGAGDVYYVSATGLPEGLVMTNGVYDQKGIISGIPTTPGTYQVTLTAVCGQWCVAPYTVVGVGTVTIVVTPDVVTPPVVTSCSGVDQVITSAANVRGSILEIGGGPSNGGIAIQIAQNSTTIVPPLTASTFFAAGNLISYTGTMSAANLCVATGATISAPVVVTPAPVACDATGVIMNYPVSKFWLDVSVNGAAPVKVNFATQANTTFVSPATTFKNGQTVSYTGTYDATGTFCDATTMTVTPAPVVVIPDTTAPIITMIGTDVTLTTGTSYVDAGATCTDNVDATCTVTTTSTVDTTVAGTYTVVYSATDAASNVATQVVRTVTVDAPVVVPPTPTYTSTGKKVEATKQVVTAVSVDTISIGTKIIRIVPTTVVKIGYGKILSVGNKIEYKGVLNTDGSVTATSIKVQ